ncbi:MAG: hypothetical protein V3S29_05095 [bacterium]
MKLLLSLLPADWVPIAIIVAVAVVAMVIVGVFSGKGPWKWLGILAIVATAGLGILVARRFGGGGGVDKEIAAVLKKVKERKEIVAKNNAEILELSNRRAELERQAGKNDDRINILKKEISDKLQTSRTLATLAEAKNEEIAEVLAKRQPGQPIRGSADILAKYGLLGTQPTLAAPVADPSPPPKKDAIAINGFVMKGDVG